VDEQFHYSQPRDLVAAEVSAVLAPRRKKRKRVGKRIAVDWWIQSKIDPVSLQKERDKLM